MPGLKEIVEARLKGDMSFPVSLFLFGFKNMDTNLNKLEGKEYALHLLFWVIIIGNTLINSSWTHDFPDRGIVLIIGGLIAPIYFNAFYLIPTYLNKNRWPSYVFTLLLLLLIVFVFKSLHFITCFAITSSAEDYVPKVQTEFINEFLVQLKRWVLGDFNQFDIFLASPTAWILYLSFSYRMGKDWIINRHLKSQVEGPEKMENDFFFVNSGTEQHRICYDDIRYIEGAGNYVTYHLKNMKLLERSTIKKTISKLPASRFVQVHRSYVVSLNQIEKIETNHISINQTRIAIGPKYKMSLKQMISTF